ncbi:EAL domain-containing protein [Cedecea colo]|uniref:EAL domain-containing protein n=2 Tax=Cedecea colo TaxID=2552946 RepID=A0ABX0VQ12_9ENTR|nr:EAL domain-containing protein [Cedecea colo]NIY49146.1 EAL domain-containing protein [Cedecea colo]
MIVSLDIVYHSHFCFLPIRLPEGQLFAVQVITNFIGADTPVRIPTELVLPHINAEQEVELFCEKLSLLEKYQDFFMTQPFPAWVNINENIADAILSRQPLITRIRRLPFIALTINESFADLNLGSDNLRLREISKLFPLALEDFGAGIATTKPIIDGLFTSIMLDKGFIHKQIHESSFIPFMQAITDQLSPFCRALIIAGIDDEASRTKARLPGFNAMQGNLWPAVPPESLAELLLPH